MAKPPVAESARESESEMASTRRVDQENYQALAPIVVQESATTSTLRWTRYETTDAFAVQESLTVVATPGAVRYETIDAADANVGPPSEKWPKITRRPVRSESASVSSAASHIENAASNQRAGGENAAGPPTDGFVVTRPETSVVQPIPTLHSGTGVDRKAGKIASEISGVEYNGSQKASIESTQPSTPAVALHTTEEQPNKPPVNKIPFKVHELIKYSRELNFDPKTGQIIGDLERGILPAFHGLFRSRMFSKEDAEWVIKNTPNIHKVLRDGRLSILPVLAADPYYDRRLVALLLDKGGDVNARDNFGLTALHYAVAYGSTGVLEELVARGADINAVGTGEDIVNRGRTPLHYAAIRGDSGDIVNELLRYGADPTLRTTNGETAAGIAKGRALQSRLIEAMEEWREEHSNDSKEFQGVVVDPLTPGVGDDTTAGTNSIESKPVRESLMIKIRAKAADDHGSPFFEADIYVYRSRHEIRLVTAFTNGERAPIESRKPACDIEFVPLYAYYHQHKQRAVLQDVKSSLGPSHSPPNSLSTLRPWSPIYEFDTDTDLFKFQEKILGEQLCHDIDSIAYVELKRDKLGATVRQINSPRVQLWREDAAKRFPSDSGPSDTSLSAVLSDKFHVAGSRLVVFFNGTDELLTMILTDDITYTIKNGHTLVFQAQKYTAIDALKFRRSLRIQISSSRAGVAGIPLDKKGLSYDDESTYERYKMFNLTFKNETSCDKFQDVWMELVETRRRERKRIKDAQRRA